ncbi:MAG: hypothetical protein FJ308_12645 [Planctomycetes bacterium]|nr:hypothetical protein [Planctomycetota bacterium]
MASDPEQKVRRVAIVLQSMDATTAKKLLSQFPDHVARDIKRTLASLGRVDPAERSAAMDELRGFMGTVSAPSVSSGSASSASRSSSPAAQLLAASEGALDSLQISREALRQTASSPTISASASAGDTRGHSSHHHHDHSSSGSGTIGTPEKNPIEPWDDIAPASLAELLRNERGIVIATVINQLPVPVATAMLQHLPVQTATEAMAHLPNLHRTDAKILEEILEEMKNKMRSMEHSKRMSQSGIEKLRAIVGYVPIDQQGIWTNALHQHAPELVRSLGQLSPTNHSQSPSSTLSNAGLVTPFGTTSPISATESQRILPPTQAMVGSGSFNSIAPQHGTGAHHASREAASTDLTFSESMHPGEGDILPFPGNSPSLRSLDELLPLADADLVRVLHANDPEQVLLALSNASRKFRSRFEKLIPAKELKRFRERLNQLQDVSLREIDDACTEIVKRAEAMVTTQAIPAFRKPKGFFRRAA